MIKNNASSHVVQVHGHASSFSPGGVALLAGKFPVETRPTTESVAVSIKMARPDGRLRAVVSAHVALVWRVLRRAGLGPADAEDASQDVFWVLAQRLDTVPERAHRSFLISTALRVASDRRLTKWHRAVTSGLDAEARASEAPLPDEALDLQRASALLDEALDTLEASDRAVFILAELEQMTRAEVAETLGVPEGTVASRLRRARESVDFSIRRFRARPRTGR